MGGGGGGGGGGGNGRRHKPPRRGGSAGGGSRTWPWLAAAACGLVLSAALGRWMLEAPAVVQGDSDTPRAKQARQLLDELVTSGATLHSPLALRETPETGLGLVTTVPLAAGAAIFTLPAGLMIHPPGVGVGVAAALLQERRSPSSAVMRHYIASLPRRCPANLAVLTDGARALVRTSLHAWKAELLERELDYLTTQVPDANATERQWATCMMLSRAFGVGSATSSQQQQQQQQQEAGDDSVMMPLVDLLNHGPNCALDIDVDVAPSGSGRGRAVILAKQALDAGAEVTFP